MEPIDIICDSCDAHMRLSPTLLDRVRGRTGRVTCKKCQQRVALDGRGDTIEVLAGGTIVEALEFEETPSNIDTDPRLSALPLELTAPSKTPSSLPPPLPEEAVAASTIHEEPSLLDLADHLRTAVEREPVFEAPPPPMRGREDSLSPHTIEEEEDMVSLGREFRSSPFTSERDFTYRSLYPETSRDEEVPSSSQASLGAPTFRRSVRPRSPRGESKALEMDLSVGAPVGEVHVVLGPDGQLLNDVDLHPERVSPVPPVSSTPIRTEKKGSGSRAVFPWAIAAVSLLALGVSLGMHAQSFVPSEPVARAEIRAKAPVSTTVSAAPLEAPADNERDTSEAEALEASEDMGDVPWEASEQPEEPSVATGEKTAQPKDEETPKAVEPPPTTVKTETPADTSSPDKSAPEASTASDSGAKETSSSAETVEAPVPEELAPFSAAAASAALREATALATACRKPTDPQGSATVVVTFAPSGRVTHAVVAGEPFAGTTTGGCIASRFRAARVPAFAGDFVTVKKTVNIQ